MARYAVGDLQGCLQPLLCLLDEVAFNPARDELWLVGDLVNRGPDSLDTLRYLYRIQDSVKVTLGNHDLHCLALARGFTQKGRHPSLEALLKAPELATLMDWLQQQALVLLSDDGRYVMSHAGIPPLWSTQQALALSAELESTLRNPTDAARFFRHMYGNAPALWHDNLQGHDRLRCITNYLTRMRICSEQGEPELTFKGARQDIPPPYRPWFEWPQPERTEIQLFGHWAALEGRTHNPNIIALDSGCVWGRHMTLLNMESGEYHHCDCPSH